MVENLQIYKDASELIKRVFIIVMYNYEKLI